MTPEDEAWIEGYGAATYECEEAIEEKDAFIDAQSEIIVAMMGVVDKACVWDAVPADLREKLRSYV